MLFERIEPRDPSCGVLLTCEHGGEILPKPWGFHGADARLSGTHWAFDLGAAALTRQLAKELGAGGVIALFSRLLIDPNRPLEADTLFRTHCDGIEVELNKRLTHEEKRTRIDSYWRPFHRAIDELLSRHAAPIIFAMHSFTPEYEGEKRAMELGVLFDSQAELGAEMGAFLADCGYITALNEPWSGKGGFLYSGERHARNHGRKAVELEVRSDLATTPEFQARLVKDLAAFFRKTPA